MGMAGKVVACGLLMCAASLNAAAADQGFYFGAIGGRADYEFEKLSFTNAAIPTVGTISPRLEIPIALFNPVPAFRYAFSPQWQRGEDDKSSAVGILAGYRIMRYAAVELNYLDLGKLKETDTVLSFSGGGVINQLNFKRSLEITGPSVSALGILPILESWSLYARAGVLFAKTKLTGAIEGYDSSSITYGSDSFLYGVGTQFDWGAHWSVRADFQRFDSVGEKNGSGRADIDLLTLGVIFRL